MHSVALCKIFMLWGHEGKFEIPILSFSLATRQGWWSTSPGWQQDRVWIAGVCLGPKAGLPACPESNT